MSLVLGASYVCVGKFTVGTSKAQLVQVAKGDVAECRGIRGINMYFIKNRYLTEIAYGQYFKETEYE